MNRLLAVILALFGSPSILLADGKNFGGALVGVSTLSADAGSAITPTSALVSVYKPENGPTFYLFGGRHVSDYVAFQANYFWNRNSLTLTSVGFASQEQVLHEQIRTSSQHGVLGDLLVFFRNRRSSARPYLSVGAGFVRLRSTEVSINSIVGAPRLPPKQFTSTAPALRVAVGIDLALGRGWAFRYSFSETIRNDPISAQLSPPGQRHLANFQNLFGFVKNF